MVREIENRNVQGFNFEREDIKKVMQGRLDAIVRIVGVCYEVCLS